MLFIGVWDSQLARLNKRPVQQCTWVQSDIAGWRYCGAWPIIMSDLHCLESVRLIVVVRKHLLLIQFTNSV